MKAIMYKELKVNQQLQKLKDDYKALFITDMQDRVDSNGNVIEGLVTRWNIWKGRYDKGGNLSYTVEELLESDYTVLVDVYFKFLALMEVLKNQGMDVKKIKEELADIFKYTNKYDSTIADFFIEKADLLKIRTCYYCDMAYVNTYIMLDKKNKLAKRRQFDVDHYLPKGECPCLALSLFNFVPSCQVCNSRIKLENLPSDQPDELKKLSPSSLLADFESNMAIRLRLIPEKIGLLGGRYIYIRAHSPYEKQVRFFHLEERYEYHKKEALRLKKLKERYPDSNIKKIAKLLNRRESSVKEDIFQISYLKNEGRCFEKLTRDILTNHKI